MALWTSIFSDNIQKKIASWHQDQEHLLLLAHTHNIQKKIARDYVHE